MKGNIIDKIFPHCQNNYYFHDYVFDYLTHIRINSRLACNNHCLCLLSFFNFQFYKYFYNYKCEINNYYNDQ